LAIAIVASSAVLANGFTRIRSNELSVTVTGSAKKRIRSDRIIWKVALKADAPQLVDAYHQISHDMPKLKNYLLSKGIAESEIVASSVQTTIIRQRGTVGPAGEDGPDQPGGKIIGYSLRQEIEIRSSDVDGVSAVSRNVTELINQGLLIDSMAPQYLYTKL